MPKTDHAESIRQLILNTEELLNEYFEQVYSFMDDEGIIKVSFTHQIQKNEYNELIAKSSISFGKRVKADIEHVIEQNLTFDFDTKKDENRP